MFAAAERQRDAARRILDAYSAASSTEKKAAKSRQSQAQEQLDLLQQGTSSQSSDFYTYRYLATEGFLPGYNFPRLPLMAYVPATNDGRGRQTYLQRPRFLALAEFGPRSLVYHEGRAYRVVRAMLSLERQSNPGPDASLPTLRVRICRSCGAGHWTDDVSMCHACGASLGDAEIVNNTYRIENVATQPAERITANDEERQRQGFDLQTTFEWASRDQHVDVRRGTASDAQGDVVHLAYGPGATITRLNKGLRRRKDRTKLGFQIDPVSGYWQKNTDEDDPIDPAASPRQPIVPAVQDRKNALLLQPVDRMLEQVALTTVQHALLRGIESVFQLEEGEILGEPMPTRDARTGVLFYEATEGGAGVLTRLVSEDDRLAEVARAALSIMHFDVTADVPDSAASLMSVDPSACVAACYRCLMSSYNQPDHEALDRRNSQAKSVLVRLVHSRVTEVNATSRPTSDSALTDDDPSVAWQLFARARGLPDPDVDPLRLGHRTLPFVWRAHYAVASIEPLDPPMVANLEARAFELVVLGTDQSVWAERTAALAALLGVRP